MCLCWLLLVLQIWRMIDFLYRPEEEVLAELDSVRPQLLLPPQ